MKKLLPLLLVFALSVKAQDTLSLNERVKIEVMQNKIDNLQKQIDDNKQHEKELQDAHKDEVEKLMQQKEDALDARMLIYVAIFVAAFVLLFGVFRWLGKSEIRRIVNVQAVMQIDEQLKTKLSNALIDEKLTALGKPLIEQMLKEITASKQKAKASADELEESSKKYKELLNELSNKKTDIDPSKSTPEENAKMKEFTEILDKVKEEKEFTQKDWYLKGLEAYHKNDDNKAIEYFSECLKLNPNPLDAFYAFYYRGLAKFRLRQYKEAINDFDEALKLERKDYVFFIRASAYERLEDFPKALEDIEQAFQLNPAAQQFLLHRERILQKMKEK